MMRQNFYKEFANIYDRLINYDVDYEQWTSFIINNLNNTCCKLLEAACGTGNITSLLAFENINITAFDISDDMLIKAYDKVRRFRNVRILNQDMARFKIDNKFDACICCCDGVNYLNITEVEAFFYNVYNHLSENSKFIFDISTTYKYRCMKDSYIYDEKDVFYVWENSFDESDNRIDMDITFFVKNEDKYYRIDEQQTHYLHETEEIKQILRNIGFDNINIYDGYTNNKVKETSNRATFVCEKNKK